MTPSTARRARSQSLRQGILDCGNTVSYQGSTVRVRLHKVANLRTGNTNDRLYVEVSCAAAQLATGATSDDPAAGGSKWHKQPGVIQPAYEKATADATSCTPVVY